MSEMEVTFVEPALPCPTKPKSQRLVARELVERLEQAVLISTGQEQRHLHFLSARMTTAGGRPAT